MKTITLKVDDNFFEEFSNLVKEYKTTKTEFIKEAIKEYKNKKEKEKLKKLFYNASLKVREKSKKINEEFEDSTNDGI
ncbi:MAG: ribbon-helix-helix protein, CopG family [Nautiliaceae bacterium]